MPTLLSELTRIADALEKLAANSYALMPEWRGEDGDTTTPEDAMADAKEHAGPTLSGTKRHAQDRMAIAQQGPACT